MTELWKEVENLPSHRLLYPDLEVSVKPFTFGEVKVLSQVSSFRDMFTAISSGIKSSISIKEISLSDFLYLSLLRKLNSVGEEKMSFKVKCPTCGKEDTVVFTTSQIEFTDLEVKEFPVVLELPDKKLEFYPLTVGDFLSLKEEEKKDPICLLAKECKSLPYEEAKDFISNADLELGEAFSEIDRLLFHGAKPMEWTCPECGTVVKKDLQGGDLLLKPFRGVSSAPKYTIRFGSK